ncbi:MAG: CRTAC1 family protein [Bryobacterales bacterium]|nr:CRTAC1 family protein [Bryobacterales bacterium]
MGLRLSSPGGQSQTRAAVLLLVGLLAACDAFAQGMALVNREGQRSPLATLDRTPPAVRFVDVAANAGLDFLHVAGGRVRKEYIIEVTGSGVAIFDYDGDGLQDVFLVNQARWDSRGDLAQPTSRLFRNRGSLRFEDTTREAGVLHSGWGQGVCAGDYDNDGDDDLFVTYWGHNVLYRNLGNGTFNAATEEAALLSGQPRWGSGCAFLDYDRDGWLDLAVANYIRFDPSQVPKPGESELCRYREAPVVCGPRGLPSESPSLFRNTGDGRFADVSEASGFSKASGIYGFSVLTGDFNDDGWADVYIACDSTPSVLLQNNRDGSFTEVGYESGTAVNEHGQEQGGMGADAGDYDHNGLVDIVKTNFDNDIPSLYRNDGGGFFSDVAVLGGLGVQTKFVGWGVAFVDVDHDTWLDILMVNGHVYRMGDDGVEGFEFEQSRNLYWNLGNGAFSDISLHAGPGVAQRSSARGAALGDLNNDGTIEVVVNNLDGSPSLLVNEAVLGNWIRVRTVGVRSNRNGIGARVTVRTGNTVQVREVRSGGSFLSQGDFRLHFGLAAAAQADEIRIRWPLGLVESFPGVRANREILLREGEGTPVDQ